MLNRADARARLNQTSAAETDRQEGLRLLEGVARSASPQWGGNDPGRNLYETATNLPSTFNPGPFPAGTVPEDLLTTEGIRFLVPLGSQSLESIAVAGGMRFNGMMFIHDNASPNLAAAFMRPA